MEKFNYIESEQLVGHRVAELQDTPQMSPADLKRKFDELVEDVVVPAFNNLVNEANNIDDEMSDESENYVSNNVIKRYVDSKISADVTELTELVNTKADAEATETILNTKADKEIVDDLLSEKVNKEEGKGLSTNDYTTQEKEKLAELDKVIVDNVLSNTSENPIANKAVKNEIDSMKANFQDGCNVIASAVTAKGVPTTSGSTPQQIAANIAQIETGGGEKKVGCNVTPSFASQVVYPNDGEVFSSVYVNSVKEIGVNKYESNIAATIEEGKHPYNPAQTVPFAKIEVDDIVLAHGENIGWDKPSVKAPLSFVTSRNATKISKVGRYLEAEIPEGCYFKDKQEYGGYKTETPPKISIELSEFGDATQNHVVAGREFTSSEGVCIEGTMPYVGEVSETLEPGETYTIPEGYHNGSGVITAEYVSPSIELVDFFYKTFSQTTDQTQSFSLEKGRYIVNAIRTYYTSSNTTANIRSASSYFQFSGADSVQPLHETTCTAIIEMNSAKSFSVKSLKPTTSGSQTSYFLVWIYKIG